MAKFVALVGGVIVLACGLAFFFLLGDEEQPVDDAAKLRTLGYVREVEVTEEKRQIEGITVLVEDKASKGINVYVPFGGNGAKLLDMQGNTVHELTDQRKECDQGWEFVRPYLDGQFLVVGEGSCSPLFLIDWQSNVIWERQEYFHHDVSFDAQGNIYSLTRERIRDPRISKEEPIFNDRLVILSPDGQIKKELSFAEMFAQNPALMEMIREDEVKDKIVFDEHVVVDKDEPAYWDVFHANTADVLSTQVDPSNTRFRPGNVLFCLRHLDLIGVIDVEAERIIWHWGRGELDNPHQPVFLSNGHILVFDNGTRRGRSRIVEMDPENGDVVNIIGEDERTAFFTARNGGLQRLPNGDTLIVESERGHVFEVAPDGTVVWEFYSFLFEDENLKRPAMYRMPRIVDYDNFPELQTILSNTAPQQTSE